MLSAIDYYLLTEVCLALKWDPILNRVLKSQFIRCILPLGKGRSIDGGRIDFALFSKTLN